MQHWNNKLILEFLFKHVIAAQTDYQVKYTYENKLKKLDH